MSFKGVYAVVDAWQRSGWKEGLHWRLLAWFARNADDRTLTVIRSQQRLATELRVTDRHVRNALKYWRDHGVLRAIEHGGGSARKPSKYILDLGVLQVVSLQLADQRAATPEMNEFRVAENMPELRNSLTSAVASATPEIHEVPELAATAQSSGVATELRNSGDATPEIQRYNSGSLGVPTLQSLQSSSEKKDSEVASTDTETASARRARPATPGGPRARLDALSIEKRERIVTLIRSLPELTNEQIARSMHSSADEVEELRGLYLHASGGSND